MQKRETAKKRELSKCIRNDSININFYFTTLNLLSLVTRKAKTPKRLQMSF